MSDRVREAMAIIEALGFPDAQQNERSALCLLAVLDLSPGRGWGDARDPLIGITPIMDWLRKHYKKDYAPNTRETIRRQTMHQFVAAGLVAYNPDKPTRAVNSPHAVYQVSPAGLALLRSYGTKSWTANLAAYRAKNASLVEQYAVQRAMNQIPVTLASENKKLNLTPGEHSTLIKAIIEDFAPRFAPGSVLIYAGDTGQKFAYLDETALKQLGLAFDSHGKMPDVVLLDVKRDWLLLVESVTSHGPVDGKRHRELKTLFASSKSPLVYVTAFPSRQVMGRFLQEIAWETEVWVADAPDHLIHFNGDRYLGPHK